MNEQVTGSVGDVVEKTVEAAEDVVRHPLIGKFARFGFYAKGLLFIIVGALAVMLSAGMPEGRIADPSGALGVIVQKPFGRLLLILFTAGAFAHGLWNFLRGLADIDEAGGNWVGVVKRSIAILIGFCYFGLAATALEYVLSARVAEAPSQAEETFVSILLAVPLFGAVLLFLIGVGVIGAGFHECYSGVSGKFTESYRIWQISRPHFIFIAILGILSFTARAVIMVIIGYFFVAAAIWNGADGSIGIDAALYTLAQSSYGKIFLFAAATGLFAHGVLAFYEAKYRRIC